MINYVRITDFAIIEDTEAFFEDGLNIITGETGSGKSIVIEAVSMALGARADSSFVRKGSKKAILQLAATDRHGEEITIVREISTNGKNLCKINGEITTVKKLRETCSCLADIHGQYDNQTLLDPTSHLEFLDRSDSQISNTLLPEYQRLFKDYSLKKKQLNQLIEKESENARKLDFYRFQVKEIDTANLKENEDTELEERINILKNSEKIFESAGEAYKNTAGEYGAITLIGNTVNEIKKISEFSEELEEISEETENIYYSLEEIAARLRDLTENLTFSPDELDSSIGRLDEINGLKKKYGSSIEEILSFREKISSELTLIENYDEEKEQLKEITEEAFAKVVACAKNLSEARVSAAKSLSKKITAELVDLNFENAELAFRFTKSDVPGPSGIDDTEITVRTNIGEDFKPLVKTASGGEISRIMLAIKNITAGRDQVPTMIFDEIDAGISGKTAAVVGRKLSEISGNHQVICITHLPQIACAGETGFKIYKETDGVVTRGYIKKLSGDDRIREVARLLGGETITDAALENAKDLLFSKQ